MRFPITGGTRRKTARHAVRRCRSTSARRRSARADTTATARGFTTTATGAAPSSVRRWPPMPWVDPEPEPCTHPDRPEPRTSDNRKVWECAGCGAQWRVVVEDMGHDVMAGERPYQIRWLTIRQPNLLTGGWTLARSLRTAQNAPSSMPAESGDNH